MYSPIRITKKTSKIFNDLDRLIFNYPHIKTHYLTAAQYALVLNDMAQQHRNDAEEFFIYNGKPVRKAPK